MSAYKLSAAIINRTKTVKKMADGQALFFRRNADASLTAWQRVEGKDVKLASISGLVTQEWLQEIRIKGYQLKTTPARDMPQPVPTFAELWGNYTSAVMSAAQPLWLPKTFTDINRRMERWAGASPIWLVPITQITQHDIAQALAPLKAARPKLFAGTLNDVKRAMDWAISDGIISINPAVTLATKLRNTERTTLHDKLPASTDLQVLGEVLRAVENSNLSGNVRNALLLQAFTCQRSGEVANARWDEYSGGVWTIPRARMKVSSGRDYDQVLSLPESVQAFLSRLPRTSEFMFPQLNNDKPICSELLPMALVRLGFKNIHTPHGWRSALRTLAADAVGDDDRPLFNAQWIEDVLDHEQRGVQQHYTRAKALKGVSLVLAWWSAQLDAVR